MRQSSALLQQIRVLVLFVLMIKNDKKKTHKVYQVQHSLALLLSHPGIFCMPRTTIFRDNTIIFQQGGIGVKKAKGYARWLPVILWGKHSFVRGQPYLTYRQWQKVMT